MSGFDEKILIANLQNKATRRSAFEKLVQEYSEKLYWQIRKIVMNHDDANDVLQNTFIKVWTNLENFRGESKLQTWFYKIAINEAISFLNKQRQHQNIPIDDDSFMQNKLESDVYFDGDEAQKKLQQAVLTLPEKQRIVFNMKYFDEMKYEEMSEILDTSVGALKASYHHAVKKIEDFLSTSN
ncbi:RNA polymerase sigma factor [Dysgonomonas sp. 520]|uniref:RNA polymerase sigma factor n=1 Tax=Dysgonomonas sp. 520 TaxID=2302931 RepID=UPI0013D3248A|nr:sigma-70 family RNA polymerase sigma factor [Dysgonomonas sp. 520]NDW09169.1 sigma-70 family RNA polymerase sigma factor [Dysgonomonas sp. 520]